MGVRVLLALSWCKLGFHTAGVMLRVVSPFPWFRLGVGDYLANLIANALACDIVGAVGIVDWDQGSDSQSHTPVFRKEPRVLSSFIPSGFCAVLFPAITIAIRFFLNIALGV